LCGAFNNNVIKKTLSFFEECRKKEADITMRVLGKRCFEFFRKRDCRIREYHEAIVNNPAYASVVQIGETLIGDFLNREVDEVYLLFNEMRSAISQVPVCRQLLPIPEFSLDESVSIRYLKEPSHTDIINDLVVRKVKLALFRSLLISVTAEHAARMTAMDSATTNCEDLIDKKTLERNKARQAAITKELVEIVSGAESL
jgi:F-type H+-transporting ATPase subunit gamma